MKFVILGIYIEIGRVLKNRILMSQKNETENKVNYLDVTENNSIYFENYGNPKGEKVLFLHGGPGLGCKEKDKFFFNPDIFHVTFFDQRGAGRSIPSGTLEANTTPHLLNDILALLDHQKIEKVILFGGSWGSTLALLFAIAHPERVQAMLLRGVFPANKRCTDYFEKGGVKAFFPEAWERYINLVPLASRDNPTAFFFKMMQSEDADIRRKFAYEYSRYGAAMMKLEISAAEIETMFGNDDFETKARIQAHYSTNNFFIPDEYIYENTERIKDIPTWIIQGRYDMICPTIYAYQLHQQLNDSRLRLVTAGHVTSEKAIQKALEIALEEVLPLS